MRFKFRFGVAVSANLCMVAIGTETDGSIVCPSNNNGIVGIKPTVGLYKQNRDNSDFLYPGYSRTYGTDS